jgi:hypothetical protein
MVLPVHINLVKCVGVGEEKLEKVKLFFKGCEDFRVIFFKPYIIKGGNFNVQKNFFQRN